MAIRDRDADIAHSPAIVAEISNVKTHNPVTGLLV